MMTSKSDVAPIRLLYHVLQASSIGGSTIDIPGTRQGRWRITTRSSSMGDNSCLASCFEGYIRAGRQTVSMVRPRLGSFDVVLSTNLMSTELQSWPLNYDLGPG